VSVTKDRLDKLYIFFTGVLIVVGGFGVRAAYKTLQAMQQQITEMKEQRSAMQGQLTTMQGQLAAMIGAGQQTDKLIEHASDQVSALRQAAGAMQDSAEAGKMAARASVKAADAALLNAQAVMKAERAHVDAEFVPFERGSAMHRFKISNFGKSRAQITSFSIAHTSLNKTLNEWPARLPRGTPDRRRVNQILPPGGEWFSIMEFDIRNYLTPEERSGERIGVFQGRVDYLDIYGMEEHYTEIVYRCTPDPSVLENVPPYNQYT
jgi:hypothetical protein